MKIIILLFFLTPVLLFSQVKISGTVKDNKGKAIEGVNIVIKGTIDGTTTDDKGYYEFTTEKKGKKILIATAIGFAEYNNDINIDEQDIKLDIILNTVEYQTDEIVVTASTFTSGTNSKVTLTPLEIVRIPGADADLYRAITTFPGSNQVDEGSRIAVRGGDPNEVLTFYDNASLYNPFIFQDAYNTQSFSTINPWGLKGINFSSGGFSAKFGNVLSGVLDLQSYDLPNSTGLFIFAGLANLSIGGTYLSNNGKFGASIAGYQVLLQPFIWLNNDNTDYNIVPTATGLGGTVAFKTSSTSLLKVFSNYDYSKVGINSISPSYTGYSTNEAKSLFVNAKYTFALTSLSALSITSSYSSYISKTQFGVLDGKNNNVYGKIRADYSVPFSNNFDFSAGAEIEYNDLNLSGKYPMLFYDMRPDAPSFTLDNSNNNSRIGLYSELHSHLFKNFIAIAGTRTDYYSISKRMVFDPRLSLVYKISDYSYLKSAIGIYHQNPSLDNFIQSRKTDFNPMQAIHYILGYEYNHKGDYIFRIEAFYKDYSSLILFNRYYQNFSSEGFGFAKGIDMFLKARINKFNGWISYSLINSKRKQFYATDETSANYDITNTFSIVGEYNFTELITAGIIYKISTGKPYTPVTSSIFDPVNNVYIPDYAETNTGRLPTYHRCDINFQYVITFAGRFAVLVLAINNLFNVNNLYDYSYTYDYSKRLDVSYNSKRFYYVGFGIQL